jgi:hypothetical protein
MCRGLFTWLDKECSDVVQVIFSKLSSEGDTHETILTHPLFQPTHYGGVFVLAFV